MKIILSPAKKMIADTQTAGFQTQMVPYIEMQSLHMLKQPE